MRQDIVRIEGEISPWDGPRTLHELLDLPESLEPHRDRLMAYHLNLVEINRMENLQLSIMDMVRKGLSGAKPGNPFWAVFQPPFSPFVQDFAQYHIYCRNVSGSVII